MFIDLDKDMTDNCSRYGDVLILCIFKKSKLVKHAAVVHYKGPLFVRRGQAQNGSQARFT